MVRYLFGQPLQNIPSGSMSTSGKVLLPSILGRLPEPDVLHQRNPSPTRSEICCPVGDGAASSHRTNAPLTVNRFDLKGMCMCEVARFASTVCNGTSTKLYLGSCGTESCAWLLIGPSTLQKSSCPGQCHMYHRRTSSTSIGRPTHPFLITARDRSYPG